MEQLELLDRMSVIDELTYKDFLAKNRSVTMGFPTRPAKVRQVAAKGGVRLKSMEPAYWHFKVHSGTLDNVWYNVDIEFKDIKQWIAQYSRDMRLWKKDKSGPDLKKIANEILFHSNWRVRCTQQNGEMEPSFKYWGFQYILTKRDATKPPEGRKPTKRNVKEYGAYCKHIELLMQVLPMYVSTFARYLNDYYKDEIGKSAAMGLRTQKAAKVAAVGLAKREVKPEEKPGLKHSKVGPKPEEEKPNAG